MPDETAKAAAKPAAAPAPAIDPRVAQLGAIVDDWFGATFRNTDLARNTVQWNGAYAAKAALKERLATLLKG